MSGFVIIVDFRAEARRRPAFRELIDSQRRALRPEGAAAAAASTWSSRRASRTASCSTRSTTTGRPSTHICSPITSAASMRSRARSCASKSVIDATLVCEGSARTDESGAIAGRESRSPVGRNDMADRASKTWPRTKSPKFGHFIVEFATPGIGHILKSAGCDFVLFDLEHSGFAFRDGQERRCAISRRPSCRRSCACRRKEYHHIARAMDMGAEGLMLPMVGTAEEARHIVDSMKYHPAGRRGVALQVAHDRYRPGVGRRQIRRRQQAHRRSSARSRPRRASRTPTRSPRSTASTASGSAISTSPCRSASPASSTTRTSSDAIDKIDRRLPRSTRRRSGAWCPTSSTGIELLRRRASISSAIPATSGCCTTRSPRRSTSLRDGVQARSWRHER